MSSTMSLMYKRNMSGQFMTHMYAFAKLVVAWLYVLTTLKTQPSSWTATVISVSKKNKKNDHLIVY